MKNIKKLILPSSFKEWLKYINFQHTKKIDMNLKRIKEVAERLNLLNSFKKVIIITGTNGKGTTGHVIESILIHSNIKVGFYNSPHLLCYTERVRVQGKNLSKKRFCHVFKKIELNRGSISLTSFEYGTLAALQLFKECNLDLIILEVGLGGRFDATNIINADISVITNIKLDHMNFLGDNLNKIGYEKAGIFRFNQDVVIGEKDLIQSVYEIANKFKVKLFRFGIDWNLKEKNNNILWKSKKNIFLYSKFLNVPYQNISTALAVIECLIKRYVFFKKKISKNSIYKGLKNLNFLGRFQILRKNPYIILDVAHNPHAANYLSNRLSEIKHYKNTKIYALVGMLKDKDIQGTLFYLKSQVNYWYLSSLHEERGTTAEHLSKYIQNKYFLFSSVKEAWIEINKKINKNDILIVFGSFYTVSKILKLNMHKNLKKLN